MSGLPTVWSSGATGPGYLAGLSSLNLSGRATSLGWRPQGSPFMILAWAAPHLQETPPFQQEEFRLHHFPLPAWAALAGRPPDPVVFGSQGRVVSMLGMPYCFGKASTKVCPRAPLFIIDGWSLPHESLVSAP